MCSWLQYKLFVYKHKTFKKASLPNTWIQKAPNSSSSGSHAVNWIHSIMKGSRSSLTNNFFLLILHFFFAAVSTSPEIKHSNFIFDLNKVKKISVDLNKNFKSKTNTHVFTHTLYHFAKVISITQTPPWNSFFFYI